MLQSLDVDIIDVTLVYPADGINFWQSLSGELRCMEVWLDRFHPEDIDDATEWIEQHWHAKDERIEHSTIRDHLADNR
ncbi:MAG: hypothetical protein U5O39_05180 [Gammaproteobacteria bacterium]|nr:hypothetical protein [Gammaproteobacteria bacterium]